MQELCKLHYFDYMKKAYNEAKGSDQAFQQDYLSEDAAK